MAAYLTPNRSKLWRTVLISALVAVAGWWTWQWLTPKHGDPVAASLLAFEKADRLTVFTAQLAPVVSSDDVRAFGILKSRQVAVIPARVDYTVDLSRLDPSRLRWDEGAKKLTVTLPALQLSNPNLDEAHAQYLREGVWITGDAQAKLTRDNTLTAGKLAADQARNPVLIGLARDAARTAMQHNLALPLKAAGYGDVTVEVKFDGE